MPPLGLSVTSPVQSTAVVSWNMTEGVEYWVFFAPTATAPAAGQPAEKWIGQVGGNTLIKATSPTTITGLANGRSYSFTVNGRVSGGPGGAVAPAVTVTPQPAGSRWFGGTPNPLGTADLRAVVSGSGFVAAGAGGALFYSADSIAWAPINFVTSTGINGLSYITNFLAVGDGGLILLSNDTVTWSQQNSGTTQKLNAIARSGTLAVAVGAGGTIITSFDGITWSPATTPLATTKDLYAVGFFAGNWYAAGAGGVLGKSVDGLVWTSLASNTTADLYALGYGSTTITTIAAGVTTLSAGVAYVAAGAGGAVLTSSDGTGWSAQTLPGGQAVNGVVFSLQFVAVGAGGSIFTSPDAQTWTAVASGTTKDIAAITTSSLGMVAVGQAGLNLVSR